MAIWTCKDCGRIADHDGPDRPPGWYRLALCGDLPVRRSETATLGLHCSLDCLLVAVMRPFGMTEDQVRSWLAGDDGANDDVASATR